MKLLATTVLFAASLAGSALDASGHAPVKGVDPVPTVTTTDPSRIDEVNIRLNLPLTTAGLPAIPLDGTFSQTFGDLLTLLSQKPGETAEERKARIEKADKALASQSILKIVDKAGKPVESGSFASVPQDDLVVKLNLPLLDPGYAVLPVARVNDDDITVGDMNRTLASMHGEMKGKAAGKKGFGDVLERLINVKLIAQEARTIGLDQLDEVKKPSELFARRKMRELLLARHVATVTVEGAAIERLYEANRSLWRLKSIEFKERAAAEKFLKKLSAKNSFDKLFDKAVKDKSAITDEGKQFLGAEALHPEMLKTIDTLKPGEVSGVIDLKEGFLIVKNLERKMREENPQLKEKIIKEELTKARAKAKESYRAELVKKLSKSNDELIKSIDFEAEKPGFEELLKDQRVLVEVDGGESITVAQVADSLKSKFFHGVDAAVRDKKVNKAVPGQIEEMIGNRVLDSEAKRTGMDKLPEFEGEVRENEEMLLFGLFLERAVMPEVKYGKKDLEEYYEKHKGEYTVPDQYVLDSIPFQNAKDADDAAVKLRQGMDFKWFKENAAGRVTTGASTTFDTKGEMVDEKMFSDEVQKELTGAKPGDYRVHAGEKESFVIAVIDVIPSKTLTLKEVEGAVAKAVHSQKVKEAFDGWIAKLREHSDVRVYIDLGKQE